MINKIFLFVLATGLFLSTQQASAFLVATEPAQLRAGVPTDVFVVGAGIEQGEQFLKSAILGANISHDRFPERQRLVIAVSNGSLSYETSLLEQIGLTVQAADKKDLGSSQLVKTLANLGVKARSLQFYGHSNTSHGFLLQSRSKRLDYNDSDLAKLGQFLDSKAFVVFHSCNTAWLLAPTAAKLWNRPVFGSFAGSNFQNLMTDNNWYFNDPGLYPERLDNRSSTSALAKFPVNCREGRCVRLKPVNMTYHNRQVGFFEKGLGFYKVFAPDNAKALIPQALVHFTMLYPTATAMTPKSSKEEFVKALADWMCPSDVSRNKSAACLSAIRTEEFRSNPTLSFFGGRAISCDNIRCGTVVKCKAFNVPFVVPCRTAEVGDDKPSTTFSDQLKLAFQGFEQLSSGAISL